MRHPSWVARHLPFLVFLAVALSLVGGMHYYLWVRLVRDVHFPPNWARALTFPIIALAIAMPATLFAARLLPGLTVRPLLWIVFICMAAGFLLVAFLALIHLARVAPFVFSRL